MSDFTLSIDAWANGTPIPSRFAFGRLNSDAQFELSENLSPRMAWSNPPEGTKSFAIVCHDPDVPSVGDDVNQQGRSVSSDLPRVDFFHWLAADIPAGVDHLDEGVASQGVTPTGKPVGALAYGRVGANSYTQWFLGDPEMGGTYGGYDGPCPPWNDLLVHRYHFTIYALSVPSLDVPEGFDGPALLSSIQDVALALARHSGTYTLNAALR